ncbi:MULTISPECIES: endonuclease/exonuclease/phosphatase family protein [Phenylobacterium]|uniref:Endonuclease/exonuclease/phosphatase family metal-dependent hydrolase n=1 Tax=Phenylobacterium koreense TaxID=266125 RepID=A0ABV2EGS1_9CAUL
MQAAARRSLRRWLVRLVLPALLTGCATTPAPQPPPPSPLKTPDIRISADGRTASLRLDVLTFNIEGVPGRGGRGGELRRIGEHLAQMRQAGEAPDIVLFQEAFSAEAKYAVRSAGYAEVAFGPARKQRRQLPGAGSRSGHKWSKGELGLKLVGSGLAIASVYRLETTASEPFSRRACAGFDCLSNKGALFARVVIPGMPGALDLFDTHMNAQGASRVSARRHLPVHRAQVWELFDFMSAHREPRNPVLLGGDFNMRRSLPRFDVFRATQRLQLAQQYCMAQPDFCQVQMSWDGDAPWMDTQDLQLFQSGQSVTIRPIREESLFDGKPGSPQLSDHDGYRVIYELSWPVASAAPSQIGRPSAKSPP